jgi:hypothetical protein
MSPSGLQNFLDGAVPYSATQKKLERWYVRRGRGSDVHSALAALEVLVQDLSPDEQLPAMEGILRALERATDDPPSWLGALRAQLLETN